MQSTGNLAFLVPCHVKFLLHLKLLELFVGGRVHEIEVICAEDMIVHLFLTHVHLVKTYTLIGELPLDLIVFILYLDWVDFRRIHGIGFHVILAHFIDVSTIGANTGELYIDSLFQCE